VSTKIKAVRFNLNGKRIVREVPVDLMMGDFLHEHLGLTGTKICCGIGVCKACTIAYQKPNEMTFNRAQSCITPVVAFQDCVIKTVEGLSENGKLNPLQEAFLKQYSFQCGYSTPGFLMGAFVLINELQRSPIRKDQIEESIQKALGQHICRCTGYVKYYAAIRDVILNTPGLVISS
jgi:aerobic-type carbon monoxide dehydrogenase small subunit (CoxS/CutS family)